MNLSGKLLVGAQTAGTSRKMLPSEVIRPRPLQVSGCQVQARPQAPQGGMGSRNKMLIQCLL